MFVSLSSSLLNEHTETTNYISRALGMLWRSAWGWERQRHHLNVLAKLTCDDIAGDGNVVRLGLQCACSLSQVKRHVVVLKIDCAQPLSACLEIPCNQTCWWRSEIVSCEAKGIGACRANLDLM